MISGTNQSKNAVTPTGARKYGVYAWGDTEATWGDALATWGDLLIAPTNQLKSSNGATTLDEGSPMGLLLSLTYSSTIISGNGVTNQSKS